ncbi:MULTISPECIES: SRPBCC domain-containing protein [Actinomadura]|uniref:SRPBCC domain-containing protein n=1 Tax=Actinomadura litoris TaxID=2678616 RepID=A0A7K1KZC8_9ACTN|nr:MULTISPECIES: SRPBCC domain-containing protein [Actinomadura]MBT2212028.1 SRPBCC domain-containing protein [Actinomadura sp. NEAU-AAG7]MUN37479.1 SRPBCC domain-containing protein [Actinomadura litoris]
MQDTEYLTAATTVDRSPEQVFAAVTDVRGWWNENLIGHSAALHDEFVFTDDTEYAGETVRAKKGIRFARFHITEFVPGRRVVWHVVDSDLTFVDDRDEWTDTRVLFDITADAQGTTLRLTHEGLSAEESACFEACSRGWTFFITKSLPQLLTTGTGRPIASYRSTTAG